MFANENTSIDDESIDYILDWTKTHTFYVQYVCNKLFAKGTDKIKLDLIHETLLEILTENQDSYLQIHNLLPVNQWNLLKAIAKEDGIKQITSQYFINKYNLSTPSSLAIALKGLLNKELITLIDDKYQLENVFLQRWLERE
jgi:hypothetical protein